MKHLRTLAALFGALLLAAAGVVSPALAGAAFVNQGYTTGTGTAASSNNTSLSVTAGNLIVVFVNYLDVSGSTTASVSDSQGNTYTAGTALRLSGSGTQARGQMFYAYNAASTGSDTITATLSTASTYFSIAVQQYSGLVTGNPFDVEATPGQTASGTTVVTGSITTATSNELLVGFLGASGTLTPGSGFSARVVNTGQSEGMDQVVASAFTGTINGTASAATGLRAYGMAFKATAPAAATGFTFSGPSSGTVAQPSSNFTLASNGSLTSALTVNLSDGGAGGTFTSGGSAVTSVTLPAGSYTSATFTYTSAAAGGSMTLTPTASGYTSSPTSLTYTASGTLIGSNSASIYFSYGNWAQNGAVYAASINAGAYFKTLFTGTSCSLGFNISSQSGTYPSEVWVEVDGVKTQYNLASSISCAPGAATSTTMGGYQPLYHFLRVTIKSTSQNVTRWAAPGSSASAVLFTGVTLATGANVQLPYVYPKVCGFSGDSITEGVRTINQSATNDADQNDALLGWANTVAERLGCEPSIIGFGGQGYTITGGGSVPVYGTAIQSIMPGYARSFSGYNLFINNECANDGYNSASQSSLTSAATSAISYLESQLPASAKLVVMDWLFDSSKASQAAVCQAALPAAIAASTSPGRATYIETTGIFSVANGGDSLNLHPSAPNDQGVIAPQIVSKLAPLLNTAAPTFRQMYH